MHHEGPAAGRGHGVDEGCEAVPVVVIVHAQPALDRHRDRTGGDHRSHAVGHQRRLAHQAGAEAAGLHPVGGAAAVEVDLVEAVFGADPRRLRQQCGLAAAQLQRHRVFHRIDRQQLRPVAVDHRVGVHHLAVQPRVRRQQAVEHAAVGIRPVHHRGDGQAEGLVVLRIGHSRGPGRPGRVEPGFYRGRRWRTLLNPSHGSLRRLAARRFAFSRP